MKKILSLLLCITLLSSMFVTTAMAASDTPNVSWDLVAHEIEAGGTVAITLNSREKVLTADGFSVKFDTTLFECTSILNSSGKKGISFTAYNPSDDEDVTLSYNKSTTDQANSEGSVGFGVTAPAANCTIYAKEPVVIITFTAKAGVSATEAKNATFTLVEQSGGDGSYNGTVDTKVVTIKKEASAEPKAPVVGTPSTVDNAKTWTVDIDNGYVASTDKLVATLYDTTNESDKQDVTLSIGNNVIGDAAWSFSLKATFTNLTKMADIGLKVAKQ